MIYEAPEHQAIYSQTAHNTDVPVHGEHTKPFLAASGLGSSEEVDHGSSPHAELQGVREAEVMVRHEK